jgi:polyphosphate kinase
MVSFKANPKLRPLLTDPAKPFIHRDLSWLQFNARVLGEAELSANPLLERVKFLSISSSNLDEFFMIRMASLGRSISVEVRREDETQLKRLRRIRSVILGSVGKAIGTQAEILEALEVELSHTGVDVVLHTEEGESAYALGKQLFEARVLPDLEPPEPYVPAQLNLLDNLQMAVHFSSGSWLRVPKKIKPVMTIRDEATGRVSLFFLDHLLAAYAGQAFRLEGYATVIRLTRDADLSVDLEDEDPESIPDVVLSNLSKRERGRPVRLQYLGGSSREFLSLGQTVLKLSPQQIFEMPKTSCLHGLWSVLGELPEEITQKDAMTYPPLQPLVALDFTAQPDHIFNYLRQRDFLLHHPYDAFDSYVNWIRAACADPHTTMIQQTVYRMDALSPVIDALKAAASVKKVRVLIELRARFDEMNNLRLADELRKAGVEVMFGFGKLKLHAKVALVTRMEEGVPRLYTHLSTGNYNAVTARQYTDLAILTANPEIGDDARHFFDSVWRGHVPSSFKRLVPAPNRLHRRILQLIESEISAATSGGSARIIGKVNTLVDEAVIENLYRASQAGVKIDLIVRGACSLVPGVKGLSENIRVISIIDRFLEHSRIYYFQNSKVMFLSSADWMPRNFFSRLEVAFPVLDDALYQYLEQVVLPTYLGDTFKARELTSEGLWKPRVPEPGQAPLRSQQYFAELAQTGYKGTSLE